MQTPNSAGTTHIRVFGGSRAASRRNWPTVGYRTFRTVLMLQVQDDVHLERAADGEGGDPRERERGGQDRRDGRRTTWKRSANQREMRRPVRPTAIPLNELTPTRSPKLRLSRSLFPGRCRDSEVALSRPPR